MWVPLHKLTFKVLRQLTEVFSVVKEIFSPKNQVRAGGRLGVGGGVERGQ